MNVVDFLADSFRSRTQYIVMWITVAITYFAWFRFVSEWGIDICPNREGDESFGCQVGNSIVTWLALMSAMM